MKWALRFLGLATLFAIPCFLVSGPWQRGLAAIAGAILSRFGVPIEMSDVEVMAPLDLGLYLAMCLASRRAPARARRRAIEWGAPIIVALEVLTLIAAVVAYMALHRGAGDGAGARLMGTLLEFVPWASAITVWLALLGAWELPIGVVARPADTPRTAGSR